MEGDKYSSGKRTHSQANMDDSNGRNKRRNFDGDRGAPAMPGANDTVYRILCPGNKIGSVIGKGGGIIKSLRQETHAKIKIADSIPGVDARVIIIFSSPKDQRKETDDKDSDGENDIEGKEEQDREPLCPAQHALFRVHERIIEEDGGASDYEDDDNKKPINVTARLLVPNNQIGCLLGKGGKIIEKMRSDTGAQIRIMSKEQLPPCAMDTDELVQISGDPIVVKKALYEISARLHENPSKQRLSFNNASQAGNPYGSGGPLFSSVNLLPQGNPIWSHQNVGAPVVGIGPPMPLFGGYGSEAGSAWGMNSSAFTALPSFGGPSRREGDKGQEVVLRVLCPNDRVGGVIGKSGSTINQIRQDSGASIKISDTMPESDETEIVVSASEYADDQVSPVIEAALILQGRCTSRSESEGHITTRLLVPSNQIGCLIGKGGSIISEMRRTTRSDIRILPKENLPKCAAQNDELVQVAGEANFAREALIQIASRLRAKAFQDTDGSAKATPSATLPKYTLPKPDGASLASHYPVRQERLSPGGMYPSSGLGYQGAGGRSSTGGYYGNMQSGGTGYDSIQGYPSSRASDTGYSGGFLKNVSTTSVEVTVPKTAVGSVLGKRGSNIEHIREISGAKIKLHDSRSGSSDRVIEISGTPEQTHAAKSLLQAFIATGQNQPTRARAY
uniref:TSA: Wollemia nobilis Ref_Wollemi_Transcript_8244_2694 transcribed RNA sequence n=1 Tax=Wollemia nobilis TaxID=56998 RepID=A0A0C9RWN6_9CONI